MKIYVPLLLFALAIMLLFTSAAASPVDINQLIPDAPAYSGSSTLTIDTGNKTSIRLTQTRGEYQYIYRLTTREQIQQAPDTHRYTYWVTTKEKTAYGSFIVDVTDSAGHTVKSGVSFNGRTKTISGLRKNTSYRVTVTLKTPPRLLQWINKPTWSVG